MKLRLTLTVRAALTLSLLACAVPHASAQRPAPLGKSCHLPGAEEALRCLSVPVPLDYRQPKGEQLTLHVTVAPAFRESANPDPLFVLAGGPGQGGSEILAVLHSTFRRVRATRDVVFIDQRGTGLSGRLACANEKEHEGMSDTELETAMKKCIASVRQPYAAYSTANAAHDIEQVRKTLRYASINLLGASYGTRLAQQYARTYPARLRALILDGVVAPDQIIPATGADGQAALERVFADCAGDRACHAAYPDLRKQYAALGERVGAGLKLDLPDPRTARPSKVTMTSERLLSTIHGILYSPLDSRRLPFLINSAHNNRWEPFVARQNMGADFSPDGPVSHLMHLAVVCAEDVPRLRGQQSDTGSALTAPILQRYQSLCAMMNVPAAPPPPTSQIKAPALLLSGALDPVTPPRRAIAAARYMGSAQHLVVNNAGHGIVQLGCTPRLLREFLDHPQRPVAADCLKEIPAPAFQLGSAGPQP